MPGRYVSLWAALGERGGGARQEGKPPGKAGSRVPLNLGVDALMREMLEITTSWEWRVRDVARLSEVFVIGGRRNGVTHRTLIRACRVLSAHCEALLSLDDEEMFRSRDLTDRRGFPDDAVIVRSDYVAGWYVYGAQMNGTNAALEILNLQARCRSVLRENRAPQSLEPACSTCGRKTLERYDGWEGLEDEASCRTCGDVYSNQRYLLILREQHEEAVARKKARGRRPRTGQV